MQPPHHPSQLVVHELDQELLIYDPQVDRTHRLNVSAALIWRHCDGKKPEEEIAQLLTNQFDIDYESALTDTRQAIQQMLEEKILTTSNQ